MRRVDGRHTPASSPPSASLFRGRINIARHHRPRNCPTSQTSPPAPSTAPPSKNRWFPIADPRCRREPPLVSPSSLLPPNCFPTTPRRSSLPPVHRNQPTLPAATVGQQLPCSDMGCQPRSGRPISWARLEPSTATTMGWPIWNSEFSYFSRELFKSTSFRFQTF
jgi:hypothetical protein